MLDLTLLLILRMKKSGCQEALTIARFLSRRVNVDARKCQFFRIIRTFSKLNVFDREMREIWVQTHMNGLSHLIWYSFPILESSHFECYTPHADVCCLREEWQMGKMAVSCCSS